jgi:RNA polymerase sigma-70 factor, ECF subfamily
METGSVRRRRPKTSAGGTLSDAQVLKAICEGDEGGLRAAVAEYGDFVHGMALLILRQPKLAEQVAHDTFVMLWRKPESFNCRGGSLKSFLTEVARNKAIDLVRHEQIVRAEESLPAETPRWLETSLPTDTSRHGEDGIKIRTALNGLHRSKKEALFLAYFRGLTYREISEVLDIQEEKAKTNIRDALISLRSSMLR